MPGPKQRATGPARERSVTMSIRELTAAEVTFTVSVEEDHEPVRGAFASGDPEYANADRAQEDEIIERLNRGEIEAWCYVAVKASWNGFAATFCLGGNSLSDDYTKETVVSEYCMKEEALQRLNQTIANVWAKLAPLATGEH